MKKLMLMMLCCSFVICSWATDFQSLKIEVRGKGAPVVLIPGLGCSGEVWQSTVAALEKQYQCHIITLPGFAGQASLPQPDHFFRQVKTQLMAYLDANSLKQVGLVGHSLGGFLALQLASEHPGRFSKLLVVDALPFLAAMQMPGATPESVKPMAQNLRSQLSQQTGAAREASQRASLTSMVTNSEELERILGWNLASDQTTLGQAVYEMLTTDLREQIARIEAPVRVLGAWVAYKDYGVTREHALQAYRQQYAKLPLAEVALTDTGRHFIMYDDPGFYFAQLQQVFPH